MPDQQATADYALDDAALLLRCRHDRYRSSGPGGQHAQKNDTAVRLVHEASGEQALCQDHRDRARNQKDALKALRLRLACSLRGQSDPKWLQQQLKGGRLRLGPGAATYHLVVAVLLDAMHAAQGSLPEAAKSCGISSAQLVKTLGASVDARQAADGIRSAFELGPMRWMARK